MPEPAGRLARTTDLSTAFAYTALHYLEMISLRNHFELVVRYVRQFYFDLIFPGSRGSFSALNTIKESRSKSPMRRASRLFFFDANGRVHQSDTFILPLKPNTNC